MVGGSSFWSSWGQLLESVKTGETAFRKVHGITNWEYRERHTDEGAIFDRAMTANSAASVDAIAGGYDFSHIRVLADVGGGHGVLLAAILAANPSVRGILFDQPHVLMDADAISNSSGAGDRLQMVSGDFFEQLPIQADAYMLKSVIHDWDDASAIRILRSCRAAMAEGAKLLVIEQVVLPANEPDPTKFLDVRMLVMQGGCERTADEFRQIYAAAGLELSKIIPTRSPLSIIEGSAA